MFLRFPVKQRSWQQSLKCTKRPCKSPYPLDTDDFCTFFDFSTAVLELNRRSIVMMKSIYKSLSTGSEESVYVQMG